MSFMVTIMLSTDFVQNLLADPQSACRLQTLSPHAGCKLQTLSIRALNRGHHCNLTRSLCLQFLRIVEWQYFIAISLGQFPTPDERGILSGNGQKNPPRLGKRKAIDYIK